MKRFGVVLVALALLFVSPCGSFSQVPGLPSLGDFGALQFGNITVTPSAKIGYRTTSLRVSFPIRSAFPYAFFGFPPNWVNPMPLELTIKRADLWVGSIALEVDTMSTIYLFGEATGNVSRQVKRKVSMPDSPWRRLTFPGAGEIDWDGHGLEWWLLDFGGGYRVRDNLSVLLGLRVDHFSVALDDPKDPTGTIILFPEHNLIGDIRTKMWVPYVGVGLSGVGYEARIIYSPITSADVGVRLQHTHGGVPFSGDQEASYTQFKSGWYVGFDADYRALAFQGFLFDVWVSGSYSIIRGLGKEDYNLEGSLFRTGQATSTFVTSSLAVGLSANLDF